MLKQGVWGKPLISKIDQALEEVMYSTEEEFHAYYKQKDEKMMAIVEGTPQILQ